MNIFGSYQYVNESKVMNYSYNVDTNMLHYTNRQNIQYKSKLVLNKIDFPDNYVNIINQVQLTNTLIMNLQTCPIIQSNIFITNSAIDIEIENPNNHNAYFVLPSQLNGAEYPDYTNDRIIKHLNKYIDDPTGGPRGQLAVHPAVGQFILDTAANNKKSRGINCVKYILDKIKTYDLTEINLINGYLYVPEKNRQFCLFLKYLNDLMIVGMEDVIVDGYYYNRSNITPNKGSNTKKHTVNMIYASAIPINNYTNKYVNVNLINIANYVMIGQYYGALQTAYKKYYNKKIKIFMMPLGGGEFKNNLTNILCNIIIAIKLLEIKYIDVYVKLDIHILTWSGNLNEYTTFKNLLKL